MITTVVADGKNEYEFIDLLKKRAQNSDKNVVPIVSEIIENVAENGDKAVVQQILSDLAMAHIAETHAVHLRSVFFIQLLLRPRLLGYASCNKVRFNVAEFQYKIHSSKLKVCLL